MVSEPQFAFYEKVCVQSDDGSRLIGYVMGRCQDDELSWHYAVQIVGSPTCCMYRENELKSTGEIGCREDFYDGSSIRVTVNEEGEGNPATDQEGNLE